VQATPLQLQQAAARVRRGVASSRSDPADFLVSGACLRMMAGAVRPGVKRGGAIDCDVARLLQAHEQEACASS
jgi:hypothetical protein